MDKNELYKNNRYIKRWAYAKRAMNLLGGKCNKCGEDHPAALSFHHHSGDKEHLVSKMFSYTTSWDKIEKEVLKCILVCENCHRKIHFNQKRYDENLAKISELEKGNLKFISIRAWTTEEDFLLNQLIDQRKSVIEIAQKLKREPSTIRRKLKEKNLRALGEKRIRTLITEEIKLKVLELSTLKTVREIAEAVGISQEAAYKIIRNCS